MTASEKTQTHIRLHPAFALRARYDTLFSQGISARTNILDLASDHGRRLPDVSIVAEESCTESIPFGVEPPVNRNPERSFFLKDTNSTFDPKNLTFKLDGVLLARVSRESILLLGTIALPPSSGSVTKPVERRVVFKLFCPDTLPVLVNDPDEPVENDETKSPIKWEEMLECDAVKRSAMFASKEAWAYSRMKALQGAEVPYSYGVYKFHVRPKNAKDFHVIGHVLEHLPSQYEVQTWQQADTTECKKRITLGASWALSKIREHGVGHGNIYSAKCIVNIGKLSSDIQEREHSNNGGYQEAQHASAEVLFVDFIHAHPLKTMWPRCDQEDQWRLLGMMNDQFALRPDEVFEWVDAIEDLKNFHTYRGSLTVYPWLSRVDEV